jgi:hypothetical protein
MTDTRNVSSLLERRGLHLQPVPELGTLGTRVQLSGEKVAQTLERSVERMFVTWP